MSAHQLVRDDVQKAPEPSAPSKVTGVAVAALVVDLIGIALMLYAVKLLRDYNHDNAAATVVGVILVLISLYPLWPTIQGFLGAGKRAKLLADKQLVAARRTAARGREDAAIGVGYGAAVIIVGGVLWLAMTSEGAVADTFLRVDAWRQSFDELIHAFWINIWVAVVSFILVLIFGLILAIMRMLPGRAGAPLRLIATVYCDVFRAIPAIVTVLLVAFGATLAFSFTQNWNIAWLGVVALTMTYSAYVAEVYRAGLASIHPSQGAAARSLGLSYSQTLRAVLVPQAVRRMVPPLMNDFISLQKDTALLSIAAIPEVLQVAKLWESKLYTLAPVTLAALFFIIITIPQARFVDYLINRDAAKRAGG
ncbi:MAG TPA: amino acid ABC transporter permease [Flexivirga sp.]|uniref:amino acid ABC transporter permease n=1 Tax=Flexivirga sp. TaxID=1962927 RepID=UPI002D0C7447|nr:amino acid ABC transporter permease [Flexivirga sp.]HWC22066.1 amino acid ABC transporter permease [Flexivirga sp.]